jgi:PAS domain S-box-containing protein
MNDAMSEPLQKERKSKLHDLIPYRRMERFLRVIIESSDDGLWVTDGKGNILYNNEASEKLTGVKNEDVIGMNLTETIARGYWEFSCSLEAIKTKKRFSAIQNMGLTGKKLLTTATPVIDENDEVILVVCNERDITRLTDLQVQLEQAEKREAKYKEELLHLKQLETIKEKFVIESKSMAKVIKTALKLSDLNESDILLLGESGTGKGLLAKLIHNSSNRRDNTYVVINCAALPETLLEAELFGYEKGAFTGARDDGKIGLIELAHEGTLFLDEIGDMPLSIQAKFLTYLDNRKVMRLGGVTERKINCTIVAATNKNLENLVKKREFRQDLYFRINTFSLEIPPLRERPEDIFALINYYLSRYNKKYCEKKRLTHATIEKMILYNFPGNVRELKNILKRAVATCENQHIDEDILKSIRFDTHADQKSLSPEKCKSMDLNKRLQSYERIILKDAMKHCKTTREMASFLNISQPSVIRKLNKANLKMPKGSIQ